MNKRIFLSPPHMNGSELAYVKAAFDSNYIAPLGPMVDAFEKAFAETVGIPHAVALSSGTAAMHLAFRNLGVGPGDEVFASTLTFIGSVSPIVFQGATPVFIDADAETWNMNPGLLESELERCSQTGRLPKAVVPTDLYGQCAELR
jgi:dTDP-4-amino-4,6-dideoxygalactose transaminase